MPRYFFNVIVRGKPIRDREGTELPDTVAARDEALRDARSLMSAAILEGRDISARSIDVCTEDGMVIMRVAFSEAISQRE